MLLGFSKVWEQHVLVWRAADRLGGVVEVTTCESFKLATTEHKIEAEVACRFKVQVNVG